MNKKTCKKIFKVLKEYIKGTEFEYKTYAVGGCVRDMMIEGAKINDIDLVVALPDGGTKLAQYLSEKGYTTDSVVEFPTYGTAMFRLKEFPEIGIECVETRKEHYPDKTDRHPEVAYGTIIEDAYRRDLTINALYYNISSCDTLDPTCKGVDDFRKHVLRATADNPVDIYIDDPLRILRLYRYWAKFANNNASFDKKTKEAAESCYERLYYISAERIRDEFVKMIMLNQPWKMILKLTGDKKPLLPYISSEIYESLKTWGGIVDVTTALYKLLNKYGENIDCLEVRLAIIVSKIKEENIIRETLKLLKFSNATIKEVIRLIHLERLLFYELQKRYRYGKRNLTPLARKMEYLCGDKKTMLKICALTDVLTCQHAEKLIGSYLVNFIECETQLVYLEEDFYGFQLPIDGNDIKNYRTDITDGREIKKLKERALKVVFSEPEITKKELLKRLKK